MPGIQCCGIERDLLWIGMIPEPSAKEDVQCSRTNTDLEGDNVVGCSVTGLGDYCPLIVLLLPILRRGKNTCVLLVDNFIHNCCVPTRRSQQTHLCHVVNPLVVNMPLFKKRKILCCDLRLDLNQ